MEKKSAVLKVLKNDRGNVTLLVKPAVFYFADYLFKPYENNGKKSFFASGVISITYKELFPHLKEIVKILNENRKPEQLEEYDISDVFSMEEDAYTLFKPSFDQNSEVRPNQYQVSLNSKKPKDFLLAGTPKDNRPVPEAKALDYQYALEIELVPGYRQEEDENYVFSIFHRGFVCGNADVSTKENDDAWDGFDMEVNEDDLPF